MKTGIETRETVLGYIQRGGSPTPFDRNLSTRMGGHATELIANGQFGRMIALKGDEDIFCCIRGGSRKVEVGDRGTRSCGAGTPDGNLLWINSVCIWITH